jgi:hypothetical protein
MYDSESPRERVGPSELRAFMQERGFESCDTLAEAQAMRDLASSLIPVELATANTLIAVQERTKSTLYVRREAGVLTGFLAFFAFSEKGEEAVRADKFHGVRLDPDWACEPSEETRMGYVWGFGGTSRASCFGVIRTGRVIRDQIFPHIGVYARAATPDGRKVMEPLGYQRASVLDPGFYYSPPYSLTQLRSLS